MKQSLTVEGMTCASCASTVEKTLNDTHGVSDVNVNLLNEKANFAYDKDQISLDEIADKLAESGYTLVLQNESADYDDSKLQHYSVEGMT